MEDGAKELVFHNGKFDLASLRTLGIYVTANWFDTGVMAHLINENFPLKKDLNTLLKVYLGPHKQKAKTLELDLVTETYGWANVPAEMMRHYATMDAHLTLELFQALRNHPTWIAENLDDYWPFKRELINVVRVMESRGILLDKVYCERMRVLAANSMADYQEMIADFNPNSTKSQYHYLVEILGIPEYKVLKKKKVKQEDGSVEVEEHWAVTFDANSYEEHWGPWLERLNHPVAEYVLGFRGWKKADSAFYRSYLEHVSPDGRLRPDYKHHKDEDSGGTVTGRLSCANPNLQQIPKTDAKKMLKKPWNAGVKRSFIPTPGYELWEVDYSQLELRLGTAYADVKELMEVFNDETRDIFNEIAAKIGLERDPTKTYVYSTQYGAGINRLVSALGVTPAEAAKIRDDYYAAYPGFRNIQDTVKSMCMRNKKVELWSGRYRHFSNPRKEAHKSFNSVIQGGAADIVERKMIEVYHKVDQVSNGEVRMLLQVHDSIIFEIKSGRAEYWIPRIKEIMSNVNSLRPGGFGVHFSVDAHPLHDNYKGENNG